MLLRQGGKKVKSFGVNFFCVFLLPSVACSIARIFEDLYKLKVGAVWPSFRCRFHFGLVLCKVREIGFGCFLGFGKLGI